MDDRLHIIVTGENGHSSTFQFSRRKTILTVAICIPLFFLTTFFSLYTSRSVFNNRHLSQKVGNLETELARNEQTTAVYLAQIEQLEKSRQQRIETLKNDYQFSLNSQKARYDLRNTTLQLENIKLKSSAISDLNARSELIESVMDNIGVKIINAMPEPQEHSGGPFIPADESPYEELMDKVDNYLKTIYYMPLGRPIDGIITSSYGNRTDPLNHKKGLHEGVDIRGKHGEKIRATAAGVVVKAFENGGYGNYVEIDHGNGYRTVYAHMQNYLVNIWESVKRGQVIGQVGSSGRSTGPHLHYEIRLNKRPIDPNKFMKVADLSHILPADGHTDVQN